MSGGQEGRRRRDWGRLERNHIRRVPVGSRQLQPTLLAAPAAASRRQRLHRREEPPARAAHAGMSVLMLVTLSLTLALHRWALAPFLHPHLAVAAVGASTSTSRNAQLSHDGGRRRQRAPLTSPPPAFIDPASLPPSAHVPSPPPANTTLPTCRIAYWIRANIAGISHFKLFKVIRNQI